MILINLYNNQIVIRFLYVICFLNLELFLVRFCIVVEPDRPRRRCRAPFINFSELLRLLILALIRLLLNFEHLNLSGDSRLVFWGSHFVHFDGLCGARLENYCWLFIIGDRGRLVLFLVVEAGRGQSGCHGN